MDDTLLAMVSMINLSIILHHNSDSKRDKWDIASIIINGLVAIWILVRGFVK